MKTSRVIIVGNGVLESWFLTEITKNDYCIGVDYAAYWLIRHGRVPEVAIGDFDSATPEQFKEIKKQVADVIRFSPEKDFTDMELAVRQGLRKKPETIIIFGALGKRLDHTMANIGLLETMEHAGVRGWIRDSDNRVTLVTDKLVLTENGGYVSVLPVSTEAIVTITGFRYSVSRKVIRRGQTIGISNEKSGKTGIITVEKGKVLVISSRE